MTMVCGDGGGDERDYEYVLVIILISFVRSIVRSFVTTYRTALV